MEALIFIMIILIASVLQTSTGFGFSILATPFLLLIFEPSEAIQINLILSLVISAFLIKAIKDDIDYGILKKFITGSIIGLPVGIITFMLIEVSSLKMAIGIVVLILTILLILRFRIRRGDKRDLAVGGLSGSLTSSIGMPGPPLLLYFSGTDTEKATLRGTTLAFYLFIYLASLIIQVIFVGTNQTVWISSLWGLPLVLIGLFVGQRLFDKINQHVFRIMVYIILLITGCYLMLDSLGVL